MRFCIALGFGVSVGLAASVILAGSIINKDSDGYNIAVSCGGGTSKTSISGGTTKSGILASSASKCEANVEGVGSIEVSGSDDVVIMNGKLRVR